MADSGLRLILILQKLPRAPRKISTRELVDYISTQGEAVTARTIQRDIAILSRMFPIIQTERQGKGKEGIGWAFSKDSANTGIPNMEPPTALTVLMSIEHLRKLLPIQVLKHLEPIQDEAKNILKNFNKSHYDIWPEKVRVISSSVLQPAAINEECLSNIYQALLNNQQFTATYNGKPNQIISPYGLIQRDNTFYLLCKFFNFKDIRITALHRYSYVTVLDTQVKADPEFNIDHYIKSGAMQWPWGKSKEKMIKLNLYINRWLKAHLSESPMSLDQSIKDTEYDDWWHLTANVMDSHQLRWWLLSQGDNLEVISPKIMRDWFKEISENLSNYYVD